MWIVEITSNFDNPPSTIHIPIVVGQFPTSHYNCSREVERYRTGNSVKKDWATRWGGLFCLMEMKNPASF